MGECSAGAERWNTNCRIYLVFPHRPDGLGHDVARKKSARQSARTLRFEARNPRRRYRLQETDRRLAGSPADPERLPTGSTRARGMTGTRTHSDAAKTRRRSEF